MKSVMTLPLTCNSHPHVRYELCARSGWTSPVTEPRSAWGKSSRRKRSGG